MAGYFEGTISDDLDIALDPETFQDQTSPAPPPAGNYLLRIKEFGPRLNKENKPVLNNGFPVYVLKKVEVVEPVELAGRTIALYQDLPTKPFDRNGVPVFKAGEFIRSVDQSRSCNGINAIDEALDEFAQQEATFRARLEWVAKDSDGAKDALAAAGLDAKYADLDDEDKKKASAIYKANELKGMKKFPMLPNGKRSHVWKSPAENEVEARAELTQFYTSNADVRIKLSA